MNLLSLGIDWMERGLIPDSILRYAIRRLLKRRLKEVVADHCEQQIEQLHMFLDNSRKARIAEVPEIANEQHYEVPSDFFLLALGERLKYSCCYFPQEATTLDQAEIAALAETCQHADLSDGMDILELGCGWGSLSLWMAENYPHSRITAVSNSRSQREFILDRVERQGLHNLTVLTADMNTLQLDGDYDRVVSVEMFEHMRNHEELMRRISNWLKPDGKLFVHIFCHRNSPYLFEEEDESDWMSKYFFTGGMMPSDSLLTHHSRHLRLSNQWRWNGTHYEKTANLWLLKMDSERDQIMSLFIETFGDKEASRWWNRWRVFFMSCAELFGVRNGQEWWVSHYLFEQQNSENSESQTNIHSLSTN